MGGFNFCNGSDLLEVDNIVGHTSSPGRSRTLILHCLWRDEGHSTWTQRENIFNQNPRLPILQTWGRAVNVLQSSLGVKLNIWEPQGAITSTKHLSDWPLETFYSKSLLFFKKLKRLKYEIYLLFALCRQLLGGIWYQGLRIMACAKRILELRSKLSSN
jgi:hypothetical protein